MTDADPSKNQLIDELKELRQKVNNLESEAENKLRRNEAIRTLLESLPQKIFLKDRNSAFLFCSRKYADAIGIRPDEIIGRTEDGFYPKELSGKCLADDHRLIERGNAEKEREKCIQDNREHGVYTEEIPIMDEAGHVAGIFGIVREVTEHIKAESDLINTETKYWQVVENLSEGIWEFDAHYLTTYVNPSMARVLGYTVREMIGRPISSFIDEREQEFAIEMIDNLVRQETGKKNRTEIRLLNKEGKPVYLGMKVTTLLDLGGKPTGFLGIIIDITRDKLLERERDQFVAVLESAPDFIGMADAKTTSFFYINPSGRRMCGIGKEEDVTAIRITDVHPEWVNQLIAQQIIPIAMREGTWEGECAFLNRYGHEVPISMVALVHRSATGEVDFFSTISRDITQQKLAVACLKKSEALYRTIIRSSMDGFWLVDMQGRLLEVNEAYSRMSGYGEIELIAMSILDLDATMTADDFTAIAQRIMVQENDRFESQHRRKDGSILCAEVSVQFLPIENGRFVYFTHDITQRKKSEEELRKAHNVLEIRVGERTAELTQLNHSLLEEIR